MKVLQLESLEELGDVQSSYYFSTDLKRADPDLIEYNLSIGENNGYTKFTFTLSKAQQGIPSEKILLLKNDD